MKESAKQLKLDKLTAELLGITLEEVQEKRRGHIASGRAREAQAVLLFVERPEAFVKKKCDNCHETFLTTYEFVSNCSTECRIDSLEKVGIDWNPMHADDMWKRSQIPTEYSIPPKALKILLDIAMSQDHSSLMSPQELGPLPQIYHEPYQANGSIDQPLTDAAQKSPEASPPVLTQLELEVEQELERLGLL